ncbi:MaoC family dehydratase [Mesorhizobium sp. 8]|uniref:MaoC family dehydratase n=1 Tax=Mesorhizobium sp. 8 TaxID=2584466 RepID=UPI0011218C2E|nr:MaoC family dehydratase [Mesorhizobium sp. 8]QDB99477.1 MaoC family dehydratase [Mesorhizobium sp. 8]
MTENEGYFFEDLRVGMSASITRTVTIEDIETFSAITGDSNPIHLDEEWASKTRFGGRIAHGMLTGGLVSAVMGTRLPGPGNIYLRQTLEFRGPVRPGDAVTATVSVTRLDPAKNRVFLDTVCHCGESEVLRGEAVLRVQSRVEPL